MGCNVYAQVRQKQLGLSVVSVFRLVSQLTGVSERTVARLNPQSVKGFVWRLQDHLKLLGRQECSVILNMSVNTPPSTDWYRELQLAAAGASTSHCENKRMRRKEGCAVAIACITPVLEF
ncbi:hypothetical protein HPB47_026883 [Ixodes persulcatus]|uniref:Uncharacterized protein n=1 Tax=Ixodes persulcatus TaxID=34615 RepID=A0AC60PZF1_IXOPE|nr:hypothetical protein HPB47_026883 [Ixodes persulcatus]